MFKVVSASGDMSVAKPRALAGISSATLSVVTTPSALRDLEHKWRDLEANANNKVSVFQSFDWVMAWSDIYLATGSKSSLHVLAGYEGSQLVFLWPLMRTRQAGFAVLTWLTEPFGQYGDVICRKGHAPRHWLAEAVRFLKRLKDIDMLRLRHVRADSHMAMHAADMFCDARVPEKAPFLDLTVYADDAAYEERYSSTQRKRRKKIRKSLEELGTLSFTRLHAGSEADAAIKHAIAEKNAWLEAKGRINRVLGCPAHLQFLKSLSRVSGGAVEVVVTEMKAGSRPVSWEVGFRHHGIHYGYITSHVNTLTDLSPGRLHMDHSQRAARTDGMTAFDLMVPNDAHKESWASGAVDTQDYFMPLSVAGRMMGFGFIRILRPLMRKVYYSMDADTLRKLHVKNAMKRLWATVTGR